MASSAAAQHDLVRVGGVATTAAGQSAPVDALELRDHLVDPVHRQVQHQRAAGAAELGQVLAVRHGRGQRGDSRQGDRLGHRRARSAPGPARRRPRRRRARRGTGRTARRARPAAASARRARRTPTGRRRRAGPRRAPGGGPRPSRRRSRRASCSRCRSSARPRGHRSSISGRHVGAGVQADRRRRDQVAGPQREQVGGARAGADEVHGHVSPFVVLQIVTGIAGPPAGEPAQRRRAGHLEPRQVTAVARHDRRRARPRPPA